MKIDVLYQFDENYAPYGGVSIYSLFCNNRHFEKIRVFILDNQIADASKEKLLNMAEEFGREIYFLDTLKLVRFMEKVGIPKYRGSYSTNMKMFAGQILPQDVNRIIYIDSDTLVVGKLDEIATLDMGDMPLAMTIDSIARGHKKHIGFEREREYHNAGVIVFEMDNWKRNQCEERIIDHVKHVRAHYLAPDQDLINIVCKDEILTISPKFDFQPLHKAFSLQTYFCFFSGKGYYSPDVIKEACENPVILHFFRFMGEFPWHKDNIHPFGKEFDAYLSKSPWHDYVKKKPDHSWVFRLEKWMYQYLPEKLFLLIFKINYEFFMYRANQMSLKNKNHQNM